VSFIVPDFGEFTSPVLPNGTNDLTLPAPERRCSHWRWGHLCHALGPPI